MMMEGLPDCIRSLMRCRDSKVWTGSFWIGLNLLPVTDMSRFSLFVFSNMWSSNLSLLP